MYLYLSFLHRVGEGIDPEISQHLHKVITAGPKTQQANGIVNNGAVRPGNGMVGLENGLLLNMNHDTIEEIEMEATPQDQGNDNDTWFVEVS